MNCPPSKRLRGLNQDVATVVDFDDSFGDDDDFTQDVLDEIDIIASQAITSATAEAGSGSKLATKPSEPALSSTRPSSSRQNKHLRTTTANRGEENTFGFNNGNAGVSNREPQGNGQQQFRSGREDSYSLLEAQRAELKRKLKEVEEEIVLKSGEIRVLRDSLKAAQQEKEAQRQNQILLDVQKEKERNDREKELNKKVQSLQSELQFKEAEINEMKTKLHSSDKIKTASPLPRNSPKILHHNSSSSSSPVGNAFITKEMFGAQIPSRTMPGKTRRNADGGASSSRSGDRQEALHPDPFLAVRAGHRQHRGGVLLGLLLQHPLSPSTLGLSHLLSMPDVHLAPGRQSAGFLLHSDGAARTGGGETPRSALSVVQSLAVTGLNMLSQSQSGSAGSSRNGRSCPGATLLLPLLDFHLAQLCQSLDSLHSSSSNGSDSSTSSSHPAGDAAPAGLGRPEEAGLPGFSMDSVGFAALRLLSLLLAHSNEVVEAVLSEDSQSRAVDNKSDHSAAGSGFSSQNALLQSLLRLCNARLSGTNLHRAGLGLKAMKTLRVLIERTPHDKHVDRLQCVLQVVCACMSTDSRLQTVSECVSVLMSMSDHQSLVKQICSHHEPCVFLKLFQFIVNRPDNQTTHENWILLDLQVVRLLNKLMTQNSENRTTNLQTSCQCYTELVQTVVIVFHRQWLDLRGSREALDSSVKAVPWWRGPAASLLRECLVLLHWLLLHHGSFSESCRPLLHMYDQVIPAVRDTLKKIPELSESEELALEEICRSEGDDTDDMDTGS
ncbi:ATR-interacting protein [Pholidichthys leucotaenia]